MKQIIIALLIIVLIVTLIAITFTINQVSNEEKSLTLDLQHRSTLLAESFRETIEPNFISKSNESIQAIVEKFADRERFAGIAVYDNKGNIKAMSSSLPEDVNEAQHIGTDAMDEDKASGGFVQFKDKQIYLLAIPLHDEKSVVGALMIAQNAGYIDNRLIEIWQTNLARLFLQISLLTLAIFLIIRWLIFAPIRGLAESLRSIRIGDGNTHKLLSNSLFLQPLTKEVSNIRRSLLEARLSAGEEARANLEKLDSPWTAERLKQFVKNTLQGRDIIIVSNREPYIHIKVGNKISFFSPASGMVTAIEPIMQACGGIWIAHGSGDADKLVVDKKDHLQVPIEEPKYTLRRVWLTEEEEKGYYYGFSNEALYPLCLMAHTRPIFSEEDWEEYKKVNNKFASVVLSEIKRLHKPIILVQDFHLALVPKLIKKARPDTTVGLFWHVPWVSAEAFSICPWKKDILDGMLGANLIGFHTQLHCNNFIETVGRELESLIDFEQFTVTRGEHLSSVKPFPISVDFSNHFNQALIPKEEFMNKKFLKDMGVETKYIGIGVDRLDYTKGILERIKAIELFLRRYPSYKENFSFIQIAAPSKNKIKSYSDFARSVEKEVDRVNSIFKKRHWRPIILINKHHSHEEINKLYKIADFCLITSLHDGMNLVAKEFIAARNDEKGVLILSQFAGASKELKEALIVNPYNGKQTAEAIHTALEMKYSEQSKRMKKLRASVRGYNIFRWSAEFLKTLTSLD